MRTLSEFIPRIKVLGHREAIRWTSAYRTRTATYTDFHGKIGAFAAYLDEQRIRKDDRVMIRAQNGIEWVAFFWACVARGVQIVPVDVGFSLDLADRIRRESGAVLTMDDAAFDQLARRPAIHDFTITVLEPDDTVEVIYTSGTTGDPKGVVHRHRNICANLEPFEREIAKYNRWAAPFQPVRILDLLPLSHMFGQSMGLYIPIFLGGAVAFTSELQPAEIMNITRENRVTVIVAVPRMLELLRQEIVRRIPSSIEMRAMGRRAPSVLTRLIRHRKVHARFGWKFWAFVVGGARLDPELEEFWSRMAFVVVQGYGLTEASPVVAVNHPFSARRGSLGKPVGGQEVRIATDGEILVRGGSVAGATDAEGWLHTGDFGSIDNEGRLYYLGRKKDLIVTADGLNVSPDDVESVLNHLPEVKDSAVVGINDQVHAALILRSEADAAAVENIVREANARLESHQRIQHWSIWPLEDFPRTQSTLKVKRAEVAAQIRAGGITPKHAQTRDPRAMSSLERVELMVELEAQHGIEIDEQAFAHAESVEELKRIGTTPALRAIPPNLGGEFALSLPARFARRIFQNAIARPLFRHYLPLTVVGIEHVLQAEAPVIFAANHTSHLDTPAVLAALPGALRRRVAPAVRAEYFRPHFEPKSFSMREVLRAHLQYAAARLLYNCYPLPQQMAGVNRAFRYTANLVRRGYCPLVFPEGARTLDGSINRFRAGIGLMSVRLRVPIVPVYIGGLFEVYSAQDAWPKRGPVRVVFGEPISFPAGTRFEDAAHAIETAVRRISLG